MSEKKKFFAVLLAFLVLYFLPVENGLFQSAVINAFKLLHEYSTKHVLTCLVPAFFIAGAIAVFVNKGAILQYLGPKAKPYIAYPIAATSGAVLAVCSCTILPLFAGIYKRGAGLGPAIAFLYSGPAINVAAIFLTASVLGFKIGFARALASIAMSIAVGFTMALLFREKKEQGKFILEDKKQKISRSLLFTFFFSLVGLLVVNGLQIENTLKLATMSLLVLLVAFI
ncbi:MAG: permease, partial [Candidatus Diapherotrites archaeon]